MFLFFQCKTRLRKKVNNDNRIDLASSAFDYKSNTMMTIKKKHILIMIVKWSKNESSIYMQQKKSWYFAYVSLCLHARFYLKGFLLLLLEWREKKRKRRTTCRHRSPARRSMITLDWLSSAFRRVLRSSSLIFTRYLLSIVSYVLSLNFSSDSHRSSSMNYNIHSNNNLTVAMCLVSIQTRTYIHIVKEEK